VGCLPGAVTTSQIKIDTLTGQSAGAARGDAELWPGCERAV